MSLLMDALKKAEQEKREAAKRLKETQEKTGGQIKLQEDEPGKAAVSEDKQTETQAKSESQEEKSPVTTEKKTTTKLSLSPLDETLSEPEAETKSPAAKSPEKTDESSLSLQKDITIDHPQIPDPADDTDFEEEIVLTRGQEKTFGLDNLSITDATTEPLEDTKNATLQDKNADTISDSRISRSVISAADLVRDMGGGKEVPTPVAAQTVFRASVRGSDKQQFLEWGMFVGLLAIILVAAGTFYYLKITPLTPETSSPFVAKGVETEQAPAINIPAPVHAEDSNLASESSAAGNSQEETVTSGEITAGTATSEEEQGEVTEQKVSEETEQQPVSADTEAREDVAASTTEPEANLVVEKPLTEEKSLPEKIEVNADAIAITRSTSVDQKDQLLNKAYSNYVSGNYALAESIYHDVLKKFPDNRDALLGIAAIAYRNGNIQSAYEKYLAVLKLFPKDIAAKTALVSLQDNSDPVQSESILKLMIQENPETAYLYFVLGNIYARQTRWADAQQSFFDAYRMESDNSDYAYNLAVSLDHLGQANASRKYYSIALDLADNSRISFDTASVIARLNTLSSISKSE